MGTATTAFMTFEEFQRLPDEPNEQELLKGQLIRMPFREARHVEAAQSLFLLLEAATELPCSASGPPLGEVHIRMAYRLSKWSAFRPDVSITYPHQPCDRFYLSSPMLVFEIVSPSQTAVTLEGKVEEFLAYGALEMWAIYLDRHAIVRDASGGVRREDHAIRSPHLPGIEIPFDQFL